MKRKFGKRLAALVLAAAMAFSPQMLSSAKAEDAAGEIKLELESMTRTGYSGGTSNEIRRGTQATGFSNTGFLFMQDMNAGDNVPDLWSEFTLTAPAGTYELYVTSKDNPDRGIFSYSVDGVKVGEADGYSSVTTGEFKEHYVGKFTLKSDSGVLRIAASGLNPSANKKYALAADFIRLVPSEPDLSSVIYEGENLTVSDTSNHGALNGPIPQGLEMCRRDRPGPAR